MPKTINEAMREFTEDYLSKLNMANPPAPTQIEAEVVQGVRDLCSLENAMRPKDDKLRAPAKLCASQIAAIMLKLYHIVRIRSGGSGADPDYDLLGIYQESGPDEGLYATDDASFKRIVKLYNYSITKRELDDVMEMMKLEAPRVDRTMDRDLIAVNNGIFDFENKTLMPFSPDYVFLAKSHVDYDPNAVNVVIHNDDDGTDWDVESWMKTLSDDPEIVDVLWEIMSAIIRPHVRWNKSAWLYSSTGNNGKGTLCELMRSLCGEDSYASIPLADFSKDFALEPLIRSTAIIVDENDVGGYLDKVANLKAVVTNDVVAINRKFKTPIAYQFYGFMVQCLNEMPRTKDKSDSFYRRQLFIPFDKNFNGIERRYIKTDYIHRPEVLRYVLRKVLHMNFYTLSEPLACKQALEEYKEYNDPVRQFLDEMLPQFKWDLVPFTFMYDLYKVWFLRTVPKGSVQGRNTFITDVLNLLTPQTGWQCPGRGVAIRAGKKMSVPEPLIIEYELKGWYNPDYTGHDQNKVATPKVKSIYNGILRLVQGGTSDEGESEKLAGEAEE